MADNSTTGRQPPSDWRLLCTWGLIALFTINTDQMPMAVAHAIIGFVFFGAGIVQIKHDERSVASDGKP